MSRSRCAHLCVASLLALSAAGCPSRGGSKPPREAPAGSSLSAAPAADRLKAFYPQTLGRFFKTGVRKYDGKGSDASVGYNYFAPNRETLIAFTAYFYPARNEGETLDEAVRRAAREVKSKNKGARQTGSETIEIKRDGERRQGRKVSFEFTRSFGGLGRRQKLVSELYVFPGAPGRWVKYRVTYPAELAAELTGRADPFVAAFPWPSGF